MSEKVTAEEIDIIEDDVFGQAVERLQSRIAQNPCKFVEHLV